MAIKLEYGDINPYRAEEAKAKAGQGYGGSDLYRNPQAPTPPPISGSNDINSVLHSMLDKRMKQYPDMRDDPIVKGIGNFAKSIAGFARDKFGNVVDSVQEGNKSYWDKKKAEKLAKKEQEDRDALAKVDELGWDIPDITSVSQPGSIVGPTGKPARSPELDAELTRAMKIRDKARAIPWYKQEVDGPTEYTDEQLDEMYHGADWDEDELGGIASSKGKITSRSGSAKDEYDSKYADMISEDDYNKLSRLEKLKMNLASEVPDRFGGLPSNVIPNTPMRPEMGIETEDEFFDAPIGDIEETDFDTFKDWAKPPRQKLWEPQTGISGKMKKLAKKQFSEISPSVKGMIKDINKMSPKEKALYLAKLNRRKFSK